MSTEAEFTPANRKTLSALALFVERRTLVMLGLGFSAGLPFLLVFDTLSAWLRASGLSLEVIGFFSLVTMIYSFKFLWAPLIDRARVPMLTAWLGHRRSWMLVCQGLIMLGLWLVAGTDPATGIKIPLPPHKGPVTLTFDLHNRHTYSEEQMKDPRTAFARYTAGIGVLTMDNTLISRAAVQSEFRKASDLVERIAGGAGPAGVKAVAPTGSESVRIVIPEAEDQVSILGEKLTVDRADGSITYSSPGRPIAIISNVMIEYRPAPPPKAAPAPRKR